MNMADLKAVTGVSDPTIIRFARRLGCSGYPELKVRLAQSLAPEAPFSHEEILPTDTVDGAVRKTLRNSINFLRRFEQDCDPAAIGRAADLMLLAHEVFLFGLGISQTIAYDAEHKFLRIGLHCRLIEGQQRQALLVTTVRKEDAVVLLSHSGETRALVELGRRGAGPGGAHHRRDRAALAPGTHLRARHRGAALRAQRGVHAARRPAQPLHRHQHAGGGHRREAGSAPAGQPGRPRPVADREDHRRRGAGPARIHRWRPRRGRRRAASDEDEAHMMPTEERDRAKYASGVKAIETYLRDGMVVGLGSGTTSHWMVRALAPRVREGLKVIGVPTSKATRDLAASLGIPLADLNDHLELDVTLDGPDEIDRAGRMIKGGGACLLWEKIVAAATRQYVVIADDRKLVDLLGRFPLPVEVIPFGWHSTERLVRELFASYGHRDVSLGCGGASARRW